MSDSQRNLLWVGVVVVVLVAAGGGIAWRARARSVTGDTAKQRISSVVSIAKRDAAGAANSLAEAAAKDPHPGVRRAAIVCLSGYRRPEDRPILEAALKDESPAVREQAAKALIGAHDDEDTLQALTRMFTESDDVDSARIAAMALSKSKQPAAVIPLVSVMDASPSPEMAALAMKALDERYGIGLDLVNVNDRTWPRYIEIIKHVDEVSDAYKEAGIPLNRNMEIVQQMIDEHAHTCHPTDDDEPLEYQWQSEE